MSERELFAQTARYAADFLETLDERPIAPEADVEELAPRSAGRCRRRARTRAPSSRRSSRTRTPGIVGIPSGRYFGFVIGGARAGGGRRRLADLGLGPERGPLRRRPVRGRRRGGLPRLARGAPRAAAGRLRRVRDRLPDGARHRARRRAPPRCSREAGWDVEQRRALRRAPPIRVVVGREAPRHDRPRAAAARARRRRRSRSSPADDQGRMRVDELRPSSRPTARRSSARQAGEVNTGRVRRLDAIADVAADARRLAARRRRVRAVGRGQPQLRHLLRGRRARRLVGDRRPQVAERPVRLRARVLRRTPRRTARR